MRIDDATYRAIFDTMAEGIVFADNDNRLAYINPAAERIRHIKAERFLGLDLLSIHSPRLRDSVTELLRAFRTGRQLFHRKKTKIRGELFENSYHAVRDKKGNYLGALMVSRAVAG